ncbi:alpha/beta hydrolase [Falsiroseomonas ponticola]|uniref:alpha/beta hydrolase n=1 Tax=Falsiroseomonas ponticola TaxID=2786951 RepID=UPI001932BFCD|nr:alpha/beta hydrolase [Roseomonas ponticola]
METRVYFATNRNHTADPAEPFGKNYNPDGPFCVRYGYADVTVKGKKPHDPKSYAVKTVEVIADVIDAGDPATKRPPTYGSDIALPALRDRMRANKADLLVFIHGFNCSFTDALENAAQLRQVYATAKRPLEVAVFSWPSDGRTVVPDVSAESSRLRLAYFNDRTDAEASASAMARVLKKLVDFVKEMAQDEMCGQRIHLVVHSMGHFALRHAIQAFGRDYKPGGMPRIFDNIFLMAADEDNDAFELAHKFQRLPELASAVHVYYANNDRVLQVSDITKSNPDRLGVAGPRTLTDLPRKVTLVDCTQVSGGGSGHSYYRLSPPVTNDVQAVLAGIPGDIMDWRHYVPAERGFRITP